MGKGMPNLSITHSRLHRVWLSMRKRCSNPNASGYKNYGGKGIKVCERWNSFANFLSDMGDQPKGMTIERIDNDIGYEPENCRWATRLEQAQNTTTTKLITVNGQTKSISAWERHLGLSQGSLWHRTKRLKISIENAILLGGKTP